MRLILVSYEFPPKGGTQSQHVAKLASGLARNGWDVEVITVADPPSSLIDPKLAESLPPNVRVHPAWSLEPTRLVQSLRRGRKPRDASAPAAQATAGSRGYTHLPRWAIRIVQAFFLPDEKVGWTLWAVAEGRRIAAEAPVDLVISSGPPFSAHGIGRRLARELRVPWVADLRDPVYGGYFFTPVTPAHARFMLRYESGIVRLASLVLLATEGMHEDLAKRYSECAAKLLTLPNLFEPEDYEGPVESHEGFEVAYVGTFQATIRAETFLRAVAALRERDPAFARDTRVRFVGPLDPETDASLAETGLTDLVERTGFVSHNDAIAAMRRADVLLLVIGPEDASRAILTSKLPEYLGARKPVLALVPQGVASAILERTGAAEIVPPTDVDAATAALERLYREWRERALPRPAAAVVEEFDAHTRLRQLAERIRALVTPHA